MKYIAFQGNRGAFTVCSDGECWTSHTMAYGVEEPDVFGVSHLHPLEFRLKEKSHSPTGFEWGYNGSGPCQLAWCILREYGLNQAQAQLLYMQFKNDVIAKLGKGDFYLTREAVENWIAGPGSEVLKLAVKT